MISVIVPYRNRESQLHTFLPHMHRFLKHQGLNFTILVVEQMDENKFNRAKLFNVGFHQANKLFPECDCFIFHDVDLLPVNPENLYICLDKPRHM